MTIVELLQSDKDRLIVSLAIIALGGAVCLSLLSIAASQILLFAAVTGAIAIRRVRRENFHAPPVLWPLVFFAIWTVIVSLTSHNVILALSETKKFFLYLILLLVPLILHDSGRQFFRIYISVFAAALVSATIGICQFAADPKLDLSHRISGPMSHWMTFSGLLMLTFIGLWAYAVCCRDRFPWWTTPLGLFLMAGMYLSQTRNSWLGAIAGVATVFVLRKRRAIIPMILILGILYLASPEIMRTRLRSSWDQSNPENRSRIELVGTALRLIKDHPWFGVGPKNVDQEALHYRGTHEFGDWLYQHMHNNLLQLAAERGIPGLILWLWLMTRQGWDAFRIYRLYNFVSSVDSGENVRAALMVSTAAMGAWVALLVAGMFEYNFGDSEVLTLYLFMAAAPYAFDRPQAKPKAECVELA